MNMFQSKKAIMTSWPDFFKGLFFGFLAGAVLIYLASKGWVPIPLP